ncbi:MAG: hypothetical protein IKO47_01660 [Ruminococcus sp.]|nr:hypothetical protein [Ruminococcus sp.]
MNRRKPDHANKGILCPLIDKGTTTEQNKTHLPKKEIGLYKDKNGSKEIKAVRSRRNVRTK